MNPNRSLLISVANANHTADLVDKLGEVALDSLLKEGALKEIPVIGTAMTLFKAGNNIAAYFFAKKIVAFLCEVEKISHEKRTDFLNKNCSDEEGVEKIGELTLMLLERIDHPTLAKLLGRAFRLMVNETISRQTFEIYSYIIVGLNPYLIRQIDQFYQYEGVMIIDAPAAIQLTNYGLVAVHMLPNYSGSSKTMARSYERTEFGEFFYDRVIKNA
ncbi:hypothetical protein [Vogesella urethralis]|uniref:hypothetical protein n=1 Tax=Vogesella urethralis TaxID=2592656 RepID=UPI0011861C7F|nr:hypothetical protein [Vogesella urethralis]